MYPIYPNTSADLVPLPAIDGPKLRAFDFQDKKQNIEFLGFCGSGAHSFVFFKVRILGEIYALKLFRFSDYQMLGPSGDQVNNNEVDIMNICFPYVDPFFAECRAYGRLQETGNEDLSIMCFGYVLLDEDTEQHLNDSFKSMPDTENVELKFDGTGYCEEVRDLPSNVRQRAQLKDGRLLPIRGIVKEWGHYHSQCSFDTQMARRYLRDIKRLHQLGIFYLDVKKDQIINGRHGDFSSAVTTPHFVTSPELNPHLTPGMIATMMTETFRCAFSDYIRFDLLVWGHNVEHVEHGKHQNRADVLALPLACKSSQWSNGFKDRLRETPARQQLFTWVNPLAHDWKSMTRSSTAGAAVPSTSANSAKNCHGISRKAATRTKSRVAKPGKSQARVRIDGGRGSTAHGATRKFKFTNTPEKWYYPGSKDTEWILDRYGGFLQWRFENGHIFPETWL